MSQEVHGMYESKIEIPAAITFFHRADTLEQVFAQAGLAGPSNQMGKLRKKSAELGTAYPVVR